MLIDALRRVLHASHALAVCAVVVEAKDERAQALYEHFGFIALPGASAVPKVWVNSRGEDVIFFDGVFFEPSLKGIFFVS